MNPRFSAQNSKNFQTTSSTESPPVETELFEADRQTDRQTDKQAGRQADTQKLTVAICNFEKGLNIS